MLQSIKHLAISGHFAHTFAQKLFLKVFARVCLIIFHGFKTATCPHAIEQIDGLLPVGVVDTFAEDVIHRFREVE